MKNNLIKILSATAFAVAMTATSFAGKPVEFRGLERAKAVSSPNCCASGESCAKQSGCCTQRLVATPALSGKGSQSGFKSVRKCTETCHVSAGSRSKLCGDGKRI